LCGRLRGVFATAWVNVGSNNLDELGQGNASTTPRKLPVQAKGEE